MKSDQTAVWSEFLVSSVLSPSKVGLLSLLKLCRSSNWSLPAAAPAAALSEKLFFHTNLKNILRPEVPAMQMKVCYTSGSEKSLLLN